MKVLFHLPFQILHQANGGKTVFFKTKEYLERAGVEVDLFEPWRTDFKKYDLVHCFSMESTDTWDFVKANGLKLAVTPISWFGVYATRRSRVFRWLKRQVRARIQCPLHPYWWEDCFSFPDVLFPQSTEQARQLRLAFGIPPQRISVVRHGVDARFAQADPTFFFKNYRVKDFILCVGRFEPRKNQLSLVRALKGTDVQLVFIGRPHSARFEWYFRQCLEEGQGLAQFITDVDHDSRILQSAYAAARVLVLPSLLEFPGLTALEAGLAGCSVAVTKVGVAGEYLGNHANYLNPYSLSSIREVVLDCYQNAPQRNSALQEHVRRNFLWENVTRGNLEGYRRILEAGTEGQD
jgi:glycosyltransferase involved in cell wall biosynthesis